MSLGGSHALITHPAYVLARWLPYKICPAKLYEIVARRFNRQRAAVKRMQSHKRKIVGGEHEHRRNVLASGSREMVCTHSGDASARRTLQPHEIESATLCLRRGFATDRYARDFLLQACRRIVACFSTRPRQADHESVLVNCQVTGTPGASPVDGTEEQKWKLPRREALGFSGDRRVGDG